jgi:hypothetical protein
MYHYHTTTITAPMNGFQNFNVSTGDLVNCDLSAGSLSLIRVSAKNPLAFHILSPLISCAKAS